MSDSDETKDVVARDSSGAEEGHDEEEVQRTPDAAPNEDVREDGDRDARVEIRREALMLRHHALQTLQRLEHELSGNLNDFVAKLSEADGDADEKALWRTLYPLYVRSTQAAERGRKSETSWLRKLRRGVGKLMGRSSRASAGEDDGLEHFFENLPHNLSGGKAFDLLLNDFPEFMKKQIERRREGIDEIVLLFGCAYAMESTEPDASSRGARIRRSDLYGFVSRELAKLPPDVAIVTDLRADVLRVVGKGLVANRVKVWVRRLLTLAAGLELKALDTKFRQNWDMVARIRDIFFNYLPSQVTSHIPSWGPTWFVTSQSRLAKVFATLFFTCQEVKTLTWLKLILAALLRLFEDDSVEYVSLGHVKRARNVKGDGRKSRGVEKTS
jgi:hypothetical protein